MRKLVIEKAAVRANMAVVRKRAAGAALYGVLTGDGGGAGLVPLARMLRDEGVGRFAVGSVEEAQELREAGFVDEEILMLRATVDREELERLVDLNVVCTISSVDTGLALNAVAENRSTVAEAHIQVDTEIVDVNVHPSKTEVRFINERPVFDLVYYGVKTALETKNSVKEGGFYQGQNGRVYKQLEKESTKIDFGVKPPQPSQLKFSNAPAQNSGWSVSAPSGYRAHRRADSYGDPADYKIKTGRIFTENETVSENEYSTTVAVDFSDKKEQAEEHGVSNTNSEKNNAPAADTAADLIVEEKDDVPAFKVVGEAFDTYILVEIKNDLYYIDKHAAHERMNFERFKKDAEKNGIASQALLAPAAVSMAPEEYEAVISNLPLLSKCGFGAEDFGSNTVLVREIPSLLDGCDVKDLILEIAQKLLEHKTDIEPEKMDWIFHSASCRAAVKGGDKTSPQERELFVQKLLSMPEIRYCPHGRPVMIRISRYVLEKQFGRVQ